MRATSSTNRDDVFGRAMADAAIGMALVTEDGRFLEVNPALCRFFGYDRATMLTKTVADVTYPPDMDSDLDHADKVAAGVIDSYNLRKRYLHADGHMLTGYLTVSGIRDEYGSLTMFMAQVVDLTHETEVAENLRLLAEHGKDVIARASDQGLLEWVSPTVTAVLGWRPDELVGRAFIDLLHADDHPSTDEAEEALGETRDGSFSARVAHADGTYSWFAVSIDAVRSADGTIQAFVGVMRPNDAEIEARKRVADREAEFRMLAENATDVVIKIGTDARISWVSPSVHETLGWEMADLLGSQPEKFLHPLDAPQMVEDVTHLTPHVPTLQRPRRIRRADGTYHWFSVRATVATSSSGEVVGRVLGLRDMEVELQAQAAVRASERVFRTAMEAAPGGMAVLSMEGRFLQANSALSVMVGRSGEWLKGHHLDDIVHPEDLAADQALRRRVGAGENLAAIRECRLLRADGSSLWVEHAVGLVRTPDGRPDSYVSQFVDISEARESRRELEFLAGHDPLTRLSNRRSLVERLQAALRQTPRTGTRVGVLFLDLDGLKEVNDSYGHAAGDELIVNVAQRIRNAVRTDDIVARLGGDEFVIVLIRVHDLEDATHVADKIRSVVAKPIPSGDLTLCVTTSLGATLAEPDEEPEHVIERADHLLYRAKASGGDRVESG
ncbi:MAG: PAS domain S-box protein [Candidatus Nanopelagicales bacterium]